MINDAGNFKWCVWRCEFVFPMGLMLFSKESHGVNDCISCLELLTLFTYPFKHTWKYFIGKGKNKKKTSILGIQKTKVEIIW